MSNWVMMAGSAMLVGAVTASGGYVYSSAQDAERTSQAMMVVQTMTQTSGSFVARKVMDGAADGQTVDDLVREGYLAARPTNPTAPRGDLPPKLVAVQDEDGAVRDVVVMSLNGDADLCNEISQRATGADAISTSTIPLIKSGCVKLPDGPTAFARL